MATLTADQMQALQTQLTQRAAVLRGQIADVEQDRSDSQVHTPQDNTVADSGERAEQTSRDAVRQAEEDRDAAELAEIAAALARMDRGDYGLCADCGTEIAPARLAVQPTALRCIECQARHERSHPNEVRATLLPGS